MSEETSKNGGTTVWVKTEAREAIEDVRGRLKVSEAIFAMAEWVRSRPNIYRALVFGAVRPDQLNDNERQEIIASLFAPQGEVSDADRKLAKEIVDSIPGPEQTSGRESSGKQKTKSFG